MILTNITDIIYYKTHKQYQELTDRLNKTTLQLKELELTKLDLEREAYVIKVELRNLEARITNEIITAGGMPKEIAYDPTQ